MTQAKAPRTAASFGVIVVELDDIKPRNESHLPNVLTLITTSTPKERFERLLNATRCPAWAQGHITQLRLDLSIKRRYPSLQRAKTAERRLIERLLRQGFIVNRRTPHRRVYVVELDSTHLTDPGKGFLYVGETSRTPDERLQQHLNSEPSRNGRNISSRWVKRYGKRLRPDLAPTGFYLAVEESEAAEARCRLDLEQQGYTVKGAHTAHDDQPHRSHRPQ